MRVLTGGSRRYGGWRDVTGDAAIIAVPMAVLRELPFSPPVPDRLRQAWRRAGLAHNAKLHVPLTRPAAASAVQSVPDRYWTWTATDGSGQVQPVLHAFAGTEAGLAALAVAEGPARWASRVAALRPELSLDTSRALVTTWNDDPWAGESYTAVTVDVAEGDGRLIAAPLGRVHFAGEHTAGAWAGLMEGALRSGARAADEVLAGLRLDRGSEPGRGEVAGHQLGAGRGVVQPRAVPAGDLVQDRAGNLGHRGPGLRGGEERVGGAQAEHGRRGDLAELGVGHDHVGPGLPGSGRSPA